MRIAVLYIAIGDYAALWPDFLASCEARFCRADDKVYFVFTDHRIAPTDGRVVVVPQDDLGWPFNTLFRFRMFQRVGEELGGFDKAVFFNANCRVDADISADEFFGAARSLLACEHPATRGMAPSLFAFEARPRSTAHVEARHRYFSGALMGGDPAAFLAVCADLAANIESDLANGIVAIWHDESHWNAYLNRHFLDLDGRLHCLSAAFLHPEEWKIRVPPKIVLRDKRRVFDVNRIKGNAPAADRMRRGWPARLRRVGHRWARLFT